MNTRKFRRSNASIGAGSMADIAFLLLIFFLVATTIDVDKGIMVKLPPFCEGPECSEPVIDKNVFSVMVNAADQLLIEGQPAEVSSLRSKAKEFISNPNRLRHLPKSPRAAIISIKNDRGTSYAAYLKVYNELRGAYNELWEEAARDRYDRSYTTLEPSIQKEIRKHIPLIISEAEPTNYGSE